MGPKLEDEDLIRVEDPHLQACKSCEKDGRKHEAHLPYSSCRSLPVKL